MNRSIFTPPALGLPGGFLPAAPCPDSLPPHLQAIADYIEAPPPRNRKERRAAAKRARSKVKS